MEGPKCCGACSHNWKKKEFVWIKLALPSASLLYVSVLHAWVRGCVYIRACVGVCTCVRACVCVHVCVRGCVYMCAWHKNRHIMNKYGMGKLEIPQAGSLENDLLHFVLLLYLIFRPDLVARVTNYKNTKREVECEINWKKILDYYGERWGKEYNSQITRVWEHLGCREIVWVSERGCVLEDGCGCEFGVSRGLWEWKWVGMFMAIVHSVRMSLCQAECNMEIESKNQK